MSTGDNASKSLFAPYIKILEVCGAPTIPIQVPTDYGLVNEVQIIILMAQVQISERKQLTNNK